MSNKTEWRAIPNYEGYYWLSNTGNVKNIQGKILTPVDCGNGLQKIKLQARGQKEEIYLSTLMAEVFPEL